MKSNRLRLIATIARRRALALEDGELPDLPEEKLPEPEAEERPEDFSDLGSRDLVRAFHELSTKGRVK
jgi:hypothetical protein